MRVVRSLVPCQSRRPAPVWPGAGAEPWRGRGRLAGNLSRSRPAGRGSVAAGTLLPPQLPESRAQLPPEPLAAHDSRVGIPTLVRALSSGKSARARSDALFGRTAARAARSHRPENLA